MFLGLRTLILPAPDLDACKRWYSELLGSEPYFDEPFYVGFNVGGYELGLDPNAPPETAPVTYWGVADADAGLAWLIVVAAEMVSGRDGLGFAVMDSRNGLRTDLLVVEMLVIGLIGVAMDRVLVRLTRIPSVQWGYAR